MTEHETRMETVAMLIQPGTNPEIVVNAVRATFPNLVVIEEQPESKTLPGVALVYLAFECCRSAPPRSLATQHSSRMLLWNTKREPKSPSVRI